MLQKLRIAALAACAVAVSAPVAHAEHVTFDCHFNTVAQDQATGDTFIGAAFGYVVSPTAGEQVSIRCFVRVDGTETASTPAGTGTMVATTADRMTYTAADTQSVDLCAEWTAGGESDVHCYGGFGDLPPESWPDVVYEIVPLVNDTGAAADAVVCSAIRTLGVPAVVNPLSGVTGVVVDPVDCDVYLGGEKLLDFAPYGD